jgi:hypothetical protein
MPAEMDKGLAGRSVDLAADLIETWESGNGIGQRAGRFADALNRRDCYVRINVACSSIPVANLRRKGLPTLAAGKYRQNFVEFVIVSEFQESLRQPGFLVR